jgi:hypothetical protein
MKRKEPQPRLEGVEFRDGFVLSDEDDLSGDDQLRGVVAVSRFTPSTTKAGPSVPKRHWIPSWAERNATLPRVGAEVSTAHLPNRLWRKS